MLIEALQMLKSLLKKDRWSISFTDGWKTAEVEMMEAQKLTKEDLLAQLLTRDPQAATDTLLKVFDDEQVKLYSDNYVLCCIIQWSVLLVLVVYHLLRVPFAPCMSLTPTKQSSFSTGRTLEGNCQINSETTTHG
jgi:hypothetical protein